jgi:YVTN family beta-propeller protein
MNDNSATVIDAATGRVLATLPTGEGPHEVAISREGRWALVSNYGVRGKPGNSITVVDVARAEVSRTITLTGFQRPHGMAFLPDDTLFAVTSETSQAVVLVDFRDGHLAATRPTRGRASHMLASTAKGDRLFTANIADATISSVDVSGRDSATVIPVGRQPEGIAVTPDGNTVWVGSNRDSLVVVVDTRRRVAIDTLHGFGMPYRLAITADSRLAVISDPVRGEVRVYTVADRRSKFTIVVPRDSLVATAEVAGSPSPEGVAASPDGRWAFVKLQGRNQGVTIDLERGAITTYAPTGVWSDGIGFSRVTHRR